MVSRRPPPFAPPGGTATPTEADSHGQEVVYWEAKYIGKVTDRVVHLGGVRMDAGQIDGGELRQTRRSRWIGLLGIALIIPLAVWQDATRNALIETFITIAGGIILIPSLMRIFGNPNRVALVLLTDHGQFPALETKPGRAHELDPPLEAVSRMVKDRLM